MEKEVNLILNYLWDIRVQISSRLLDIIILSSENHFELEI